MAPLYQQRHNVRISNRDYINSVANSVNIMHSEVHLTIQQLAFHS
jgi:hypothetical protein